MDNNKRILGLDIGTTSIGWAIVEATNKKKLDPKTGKEVDTSTDINNDRIGILHKDGKAAVGVRIIKQDTASIQQFDKGLKLNTNSTSTPTATRRIKRGSRRLKSRYKLRRQKLNQVLYFLEMMPDSNFYTNDKTGKRKGNFKIEDIGKAIYELRDRAIKQQITLSEWGRIMLHLNQWRGYSSDRFAKADTEELSAKNDFYTSIVTNIIELDPKIKKGTNGKADFIEHYLYEIHFENGDIGIDKVKWSTEAKTKFTEKMPHTYKKKTDKDGKIELTWSKVKEDDYAYRKWKINDSLTSFCSDGGTVGSYFYQNFYGNNKNINRIRTNIVNRDWYEKEFDKIFELQYEKNKIHFEKFNIDDIVASAFHKTYKDDTENRTYKQILNEVKKNGEGVKEQIHYLISKVIIYYQRPWQQAKNKGECTFEKVLVKVDRKIKGSEEIEKVDEYRGRTVIPRSHPLHQEFKIWNQINNVKLFFNNYDVRFEILKDKAEECKNITGFESNEIKELLYSELNIKGEVNWRTFSEKLLKDKHPLIVLGIGDYKTKEEKDLPPIFFTVNYTKRKKKTNEIDDDKLKGNKTLYQIDKILQLENKDWYNEINPISKEQAITNVQLLWEIIYDINISDPLKVSELIQKKFIHISLEKANQLSKIKFDDAGMAQLSAKSIRNLLPLMSSGDNITVKATKKINSLINKNEEEKLLKDTDKLVGLKDFFRDEKTRLLLTKKSKTNDFIYLSYTEASAIVYGSHSSKGIQGNFKEIETVRQHSMNNPVVEKIVNETIRVVNDIYNEYGFDEVRIELSRELKATAEEREQMTEGIKYNTEKIEWAKQMLREIKEIGTPLDTEPSTKSNIDKIRIYEEVVKQLKQEEYKTKVKEYKLDEPSKAEVGKYLLWLQQNFKCPYTNAPIPLSDVFARNKLVEIEHILPRKRYPNNSYSNKVITWEVINKAKSDRTAYEFIVSKRTNDKFKLSDGTDVNLVAKIAWDEHVKAMFPKGSKQNNLLRKEIPDNPIERTLKETQYINKKFKEKLAEIVGSEKVWVTSGSVTDILRNNWSLNEVMKELMRPRFEQFNVGENKPRLTLNYLTKHLNTKTNKEEESENFEGYSKRLDHRHHALDAIIIACTKQNHVQYINTMNAINTADLDNPSDVAQKYKYLKEDVCGGNSSKVNKLPWKTTSFLEDVKDVLQKVIVAHKVNNVIISPSTNNNAKNLSTKQSISVRGNLHKETNYAKKNYFENEILATEKLIKKLLDNKFDNQNQTMILPRSFTQLIKELVFKKPIQDELIPLFEPLDKINLNKNTAKKANECTISVLEKILLKKRNDENLLFNKKENKQLEWVSIYSDNRASNRPNGFYIDLNSEKEVNTIIEPRTRKIALYRLAYVKQKEDEINSQGLDKKDKDGKIRDIRAIKLYSNAIYEIRIRNSDGSFVWKEIKNITENDFQKICYPKDEQTKNIKQKFNAINLLEYKSSYIEKPIFTTNIPIEIKKARQKGWYQKGLYEIENGKFVYSEDSSYFFVMKEENSIKRNIIPLKFIDAVKILEYRKNTKFTAIDLLPLHLKKSANEKLLFTLQRSDLVYIPDELPKGENYTEQHLKEINWMDFKSILPRLYIVKDMNASGPGVAFTKFYTSDSIKLTEKNAKDFFKNPELKGDLIEEIKYGNQPMLQRCIKVFTNRLGTKIVPYWKFPNGIWDNAAAKNLGL